MVMPELEHHILYISEISPDKDVMSGSVIKTRWTDSGQDNTSSFPHLVK